ncbi:MAG: phage protease [Gemmobacter sp.]|uniref:phage protease n=1 Tax=Gemmobacter sp. TaxID=1898957 RepID=UPI00391D085A
MFDNQLAICEAALPPGAAPEWVHLLPPKGRITARDGRKFISRKSCGFAGDDPAALVADFNARAVDAAVDFAHQSELADAKTGGPVPATGWIEELRADATGLCALVEWTARAAALIAAREYRYLSPAFLHDKAGVITRLKSAGLVHNPALQLTALASQEDVMTPDTIPPKGTPEPDLAARLAALLGLPEGTSMEDVLAMIAARLATPAKQGSDTAPAMAAEVTPDPARFVPVEAMQALLAERNSYIATAREIEATAKVERALLDGHITNGMRSWALALCTQDPASFDAFLSKSPAPYKHLFDNTPPPLYHKTGLGQEPAASAAAASICAQLGLPPGALNE